MDSRLGPRWQQVADQQEADEREFISFADITAFVKRYLRTIAGSVAIALFCAWFYVVTTDPVYTAQTQILIEPKVPQLLQQQQTEVNLTLDTAQVESQIAVMQSEKIAKMVIGGLDLDNDATFRSQSPTITERFAKLGRMLADAVGIANPGSDAGNAKTTTGDASEFERNRYTMWAFTEGLDIRRVGVSYAINISFQSPDPDMAAKIANATAEAFVREQLETKASSAREGGAWLELRLNELRAQMNQATKIAQEFRAKHDYGVGQRPSDEPGQDGGSVGNAPTLEELEVTADTYRKMYESFLQAFTSSVSQQSYPVADARVITPATRPLVPSAPRKKLVLSFGALAGLIAGIGLAFLRNALDRTLRSPRQLREEFGLECIGEMPPLSGMGARDTLNEAAVSPLSDYSNSLRRVKTAIGLADSGSSLRCIGVVSGLPSDGKSSFASNLAALYAMSGARTLVIDADIHNSVLSDGLVLTPNATVEKGKGGRAVAPLVVPAANAIFEVLPSKVADARNILAPRNMSVLLAELQTYDMIIVDLPPLTCGSDRLAASPLFDGVILVAEWGRTPLDLFGELVKTMHASRTAIVGAVMTNVRVRTDKTYNGHFSSRRKAR